MTINLFAVPDIVNLIINECNPCEDLNSIIRINKTFSHLTSVHPLYVSFVKLFNDFYKPYSKSIFTDCVIIHQLLSTACQTNNLLYKYLDRYYEVDVSDFFRPGYSCGNTGVFGDCCEKGYGEIVDWMIQKRGNDIIFGSQPNFNVIFWNVCTSGHLGVAQSLIRTLLAQKFLGPSMTFKEFFKTSCVNGYLELAQWLVKINQINGWDLINWTDETIFIESCCNGHLEIVKWLVAYGKEIGYPINIHAKGELPFI